MIDLELIVIGTMFIYLAIMTVTLFSITKKSVKIIIADLLWGILFLATTIILFAYQTKSWKLGRKGLFIFVFVSLFHFIINSIFLFIQGLLSNSISNQENKQKMLMQKKKCFLLHIIVLFGIYFFVEFYWKLNIKWVWSILVFTTTNYILFSVLFRKIIGVAQPSILQTLINKLNDVPCLLKKIFKKYKKT